MNINKAYGSVEVFFSYVPSSSLYIQLQTNVKGQPSFSEVDTGADPQDVSVLVHSDIDVSGLMYINVSTLLGLDVVDRSDFPCDTGVTEKLDVRIFIFNARVSVYVNSKWMYSYNLRTVEYSATTDLSIIVYGSAGTLTEINRTEISDGREAVYVDYESTSDNAISSIIQDRPIEIFSAIGRAAEFTYDATKADVNAIRVNSYTKTETGQSQASSDGLVYSMDVGISNDTYIAKELGLITRLYRLPDLDSGVERAVKTLQRKARQSRIRVDTSGRFDPRLEISDVLVFDNVIISGTGRSVTDRVIIEDLTINVSDGAQSQGASGRREVDSVV